MPRGELKGATYRCPVCGAEVAILAPLIGEFEPHCCNRAMEATSWQIAFYICPVCGAEIGVLQPGKGLFMPRCCNTSMVASAA